MVGKKKWLILTLALTLLLAACGQKPKTAAPETPPAPISGGEQTQAETKIEVENNGGYYVRVNDKIYFRRYGADALGATATFGEFAGEWNVDGESELVALDPVSGKTETLFAETGGGPLRYGDGGFYLHEVVNERDCVGWYALDGSDSELLCAGRPLGITEDGLLAVESTEYTDSYHATYTFYRDKKPVGKAETDNVLYGAGLTEKGLFLIGENDGDADGAFYVWQIAPDGGIINLGALPETQDDIAYYIAQPDRFLDMGDKVVIGVGYYAGTGHFLNEAQFVEATPGQENTVRELEFPEDVDGEGYDAEGMPYPVPAADGTVAFAPALAGALRIGWKTEDSGALEIYENGGWRVLREHFKPDYADGYGYRCIEQHMEYISGTAYVTLACAHASPVGSVGWRDAFTLLDMVYLAVDGGGTVREFDCVEYDTELYGDVWFIEGASTLLWRQVGDDAEGGDEQLYAYAIPISEDADWCGGWEAVWDGWTGLLPEDYGEAEASYYGFPVPDSEPAGRLCLTLDRDGTVASLARKAPDELLAVGFDAQDPIVGAVETLSLERRDNDEDTPWFWTKLCALEPGVRVRVERTPDEPDDVEQLAMIEGAFVAGETLCDRVLDRGEYIALRASLPWHPELRVSASKDGKWGAYVFGEDNWQHLETEGSAHPELKITAEPMSGSMDYYFETGKGLDEELRGTWLYRAQNGEGYQCFLTFGDEGEELYTGDGEYGCRLVWHLDRLYAEEYQKPDLLCLSVGDEYTAARLGVSGSAGDYLVELYHTDGEEILELTQANNGDGYLGGALLEPDARGTHRFVLTRSRGIGDMGARRRGATFTAAAVRWDRDAGMLWLRETEQTGEYEDGSAVYCAAPTAPCLAYPVEAQTVEKALHGVGDAEHPLCMVTVDVDRNGTVTRVTPFGV